MENKHYILIDLAVLPEIFGKVLAVKRMVAEHTEPSLSAACKRMEISRSAFYKYKDSVFDYKDKALQRIVNYSITLRDEAGVLSNLLTAISGLHTNILTVNQNIPVDGVALVSVSLKLDEQSENPAYITQTIGQQPGVVRVRLLSGE